MNNFKYLILSLFLTFFAGISSLQLKGQIIESFADGDFTNNPAWSGDDTNYKISTYSSSTWSIQPRLQLNGTVSGAKHLRFNAPIANIDSTEWRFWIRIGLSGGTSSTNNARVYLTSDSENLLGPLNGYYVMFGDDALSSSDNITLWKQTGLGATKIINGTIGNISAAKNTSIKVLRDNSGLWKLYSDTLGGNNYQLEGFATDVTHTSSAYTGVYCKFTSSNNTTFYFDDFFVGSIVKDLVPPTVISATIINDTQLELQFSESILPSTAINVNFYLLDHGMGNPTLAQPYGANSSAVRLTFASPFTQNIPYLLTVSDITDMEGNIIIPQNIPFTYIIVPPTVTNAAIINDTQIELQFSESILPVTATNVNFYLLNHGMGNPTLAQLFGTNNSAVRLTFASPFTQNIPYILTVTGIKDLEGNVIISQDIPVSYFSAHPWDVVINEIMADPDPVVGLPNTEYIELKNNTPLPINLNGWLLKVGTTTKTLPLYTLLPDSFVIITSTSAPTFDPSIPVITVSSLSISNAGQEITLSTPSNMVIHYVNFSDTWYRDNFKKNGGWSLEQIDPFNYCGEASNWIASSNLLGGTPGRKNSQYNSNPDLVAPYLLKAVVQNYKSIMLYFSESMKENTITNVAKYMASSNLGVPISAEASSPIFKSVLLTFADTMVVGEIYNIKVMDTISDCSGNIIPFNNSVQFGIAYQPNVGDVVINEILSNPREGGVDFVELYNRSEKIVDLKQLLLGRIEYGAPVYKTISTEGYLLFPKEYVLLSSNTLAVKREYPTFTNTNFVQMASFPSYSNDDGVVLLGDLNTIVIDRVDYDVDMHYGMLKSSDGVSLERISPLRPSDDKSNWHSAASTVNYATPGYKNSQWADVFADENEITIHPDIFSPNMDGIDDVATIAYKFNEPGFRISIWVYNAAGFKVKQLVNNDIAPMEGFYSWDGTAEDNSNASSGIYLFVIEIWKLNGTVKKYKKVVTIGARF